MTVDENALRDLISSEGVPVRLQVGDGTPHCIGWIDHADLTSGDLNVVGRAVGEFLRAAAAFYDDTDQS